MKLFLGIFLLSVCVFAKSPENAESYVCPAQGRSKIAIKPALLHETHEKHVIGICGEKLTETNNFSNLDVYVYPEIKKPFFTNKEKNRKFLVMEKHDGILLIEKILVDKEYVEVFRHEIACDKEKCKNEKEICIVMNKVKQKWITKNVKNSKIKSRMKKLGCA